MPTTSSPNQMKPPAFSLKLCCSKRSHPLHLFLVFFHFCSSSLHGCGSQFAEVFFLFFFEFVLYVLDRILFSGVLLSATVLHDFVVWLKMVQKFPLFYFILFFSYEIWHLIWVFVWQVWEFRAVWLWKWELFSSSENSSNEFVFDCQFSKRVLENIFGKRGHF